MCCEIVFSITLLWIIFPPFKNIELADHRGKDGRLELVDVAGLIAFLYRTLQPCVLDPYYCCNKLPWGLRNTNLLSYIIFIILSSGDQKSKINLAKCQQGWSPQERTYSWPLPGSRGCPHPLAPWMEALSLQSLTPMSHALLSELGLLLPSFKDPHDCIRPTSLILDIISPSQDS